MIVAEVIGTVTLSRAHSSLKGGRFCLAVPRSLENLQGTSDARDEAIVIYDDLSAGNGSLVAVSQGTEAAQPFLPEIKPIDASNAAIIDSLDLVPARRSLK